MDEFGFLDIANNEGTIYVSRMSKYLDHLIGLPEEERKKTLNSLCAGAVNSSAIEGITLNKDEIMNIWLNRIEDYKASLENDSVEGEKRPSN